MTDNLPSKEECLKLLTKAGCSEKVITHCLAVENLALKIARLTDCDLDLVSCGALLHDIGRGKTHGVEHAIKGGEIAREYELPKEIIRIIENHLGAGISRYKAKELGLPEMDFTPTTLEEKIVAHADNLIEENKKQPIIKVIQRFESQGYPEIANKIRRLHEELSTICKMDLDLIQI
jgi:tRNA (cytidine56-2'-O)-methyltransferase